MHAIGSILLLINGMLCSYAASRTGLRIVKEPHIARPRISGFSDCLLFARSLLAGLLPSR